ncbi:SixA phosphatase family protein [Geovibrio thiophilus]|nr:histidine phosphatase family protein [Geovibrio thiophilus]
MRQYFIRHAHAQERHEWEEDDMLRPLTAEGKRRMELAARRYFSMYPAPYHVVTSEAVRAMQTAEIVCGVTKGELVREPLLNPGADIACWLEAVKKLPGNTTTAFVGHEPDMTDFLSFYMAGSSMEIVLKKGSICHLENRHLVNLVQQKLLTD